MAPYIKIKERGTIQKCISAFFPIIHIQYIVYDSLPMLSIHPAMCCVFQTAVDREKLGHWLDIDSDCTHSNIEQLFLASCVCVCMCMWELPLTWILQILKAHAPTETLAVDNKSAGFFFFLSFSTEIDHSCTTTHTHMHNEVHSCEERGGKCESCSLSEQETKTVIKHDQCFKEKGSGTCSPHVKHFFMSPSQSPVLPVILSLWACCRGEGHQIQRDRLPSTEKHNWI